MNNIIANFTSLDGRIGRQSWWIGIVILLVINIIISFLILPMVGMSMMPNFAGMMADPNNVDAAAMAAAVESSMRTAGWVGLVVSLIFAYPYAALGVKRRHDKDNSGLDVWIFTGLLLVSQLVTALGLGMSMTQITPEIAVPTPGIISTILSVIVLVYAIYMLVVLGFLKGTTGPNQYGPDPLGGPAV